MVHIEINLWTNILFGFENVLLYRRYENTNDLSVRYQISKEKLKLILQVFNFSVLCRKSFEDDPDATEEDVQAELGIIR